MDKVNIHTDVIKQDNTNNEDLSQSLKRCTSCPGNVSILDKWHKCINSDTSCNFDDRNDLGGSPADNKTVVYSMCCHTSKNANDSLSKNLQNDCQSSGVSSQEVFPRMTKAKSDSPLNEKVNTFSISSGFNSTENQLSSQNDDLQIKDTGNSEDGKSTFKPGKDIPTCSLENRILLSHLVSKDKPSLDFQSKQSIHHTCSSENKNLNKTQRPEKSDDIQSAVSKTFDNVSKHISVEMLAKLISEKNNDDIQNLLPSPEKIPKAVFDKLARELIRVKADNCVLKKFLDELLVEYAVMQRKVQIYEKEGRNVDVDQMCQMNIQLPGHKESTRHSHVETSNNNAIFNQERSVDLSRDYTHKSIDVQQFKEMEERDEAATMLRRHRIDYDYEGLIHNLNLEIKGLSYKNARMKQCYEEQQKELQKSNTDCQNQMQRAERLEDFLQDERNRSTRDVGALGKKIKSLEAKLNSKDTGPDSESNNGIKNSSEPPLNKSQYIKQGAFPKRKE